MAIRPRRDRTITRRQRRVERARQQAEEGTRLGEGVSEEENQIMVVGVETPCALERENAFDNNRVVAGSSLAKDIDKWTQAIENRTDCLSLQQACVGALSSLGVDLDDSTRNIQEKLSEIAPILKLPTNPLRLVGWVKKFSVGRILPDYKATIDLIRRTIEVAQALARITATIQQVRFKLEQCAIANANEAVFIVENVIDEAVFNIQLDIEDAIGEAICQGLKGINITGDDVFDTLNAIQQVDFLLRDAELIQQNLEFSLQSSLNQVGQTQQLVADITGIPSVLDVSSVDQFVATVDSEQYAEYEQQLLALATQEDPENTSPPEITGTLVIGNVLTASTGVWTGENVSFDFQWLRDGQEIENATQSTYTTTIADVERRLSVRVVANTATASIDVVSEKTDPIVFALSTENTPALMGSAVVGQQLVVSDGVWPFDPTTLMFEFIRVPASGPTVRVQTLSGNNVYEVKLADVGSSIRARVVATGLNFTVSAQTDQSAVVTT